MTRRLLVLFVIALAACGKLEPRTGSAGEPCARNADCAEGLACSDAVCVADRFRACDAGTKRCNGGALEICRASADGWNVVKCPGGCLDGACLKPPCDPEQRKCEGSLQYECLADGSAWQFIASCPSGCDTATNECLAPTCVPFELRCKAGEPSVIETCNSRGSGWTESSCTLPGTESVCAAGRCVPKVCPATGPRASRCDGDVRAVCNERGSAYDPVELCAYGCGQPSESTAACKPAVCGSGDEACEATALLRCLPDRRGFAFAQFCPSGCAVTNGRAACLPPICPPLARRCARDVDGSQLAQTCNAGGTAWDITERCPTGCVNGACVSEDAACVDGTRRCNGREAEVCVRVGSGITTWRFEERCLGLCLAGACDDVGACGCAGGVTATGDTCGSSARPALVLKALGVEANTALPADGVSSFLVHSEPITAASGQLVRDGTLITFSSDSSDILFMSPDADPALPGLQRPTAAGRARVVLRAPANAREVVVTAGVGGRCAGVLPMRFTAPPSGAKKVWIAEDFTTTRLVDRAATNAQWDVTHGRLRAAAAFSLGTGADGPYTVSAGTRDLWDDALARAFPVSAIGTQDATLDTFASGLAPGDEVLLLNVSGAAGAVGTYEFKRLVAVDGTRVRFSEPLRAVLGASTNADLSGQRIVAQRVPQFTEVTVAAQATLTTRAYSAAAGGGTGVLAFRARGTVRIAGAVQMSEKGLPAGTQQNGTSAPLLPRLLLGAGASRPGGGIVFIAGRTLTLRGDGQPSPTGTISSLTGGGQGGTIWLQGGQLALGSNLVAATGSGTGLAGRIRLDYGAAELAQTNPEAALGQSAAFYAQSVASYVEPPGAALVRSAHLLGLVGGAGTLRAGLPVAGSGISIDVSADGGGTAFWVSSTAGTAEFPNGNKHFRWRARLETLGDEPVEIYGLAFRIDVN